MASNSRKKGNTGKRYSEDQKRQIMKFVRSQGRGGIAEAGRKYGVSYIALRRWMNSAGVRSGASKTGKAKSLDGRKLRRVRSAVTSLKEIKNRVIALSRTLKQLLH